MRARSRVVHRDMNENLLADVARLSDEALLARLKLLAMSERDATVEVVAHLAELDTRRAHLGEGPGSVCSYCRDVLGYSEDAAWNRAATANVVRRFPAVLGWLADGTLNVTTVRMLRSVLTAKNHVDVLTEARRRSKSEVELIVRRLAPKPGVPSTIRRVPSPPVVDQPALLQPVNQAAVSPDTPAPGPMASTSTSPSATTTARRPVIAPLAPDRYHVQMTVSKETHDKLRRAQDLLCREIRSGDPALILDRALDALLEKAEKKKLAATAKPRPSRGSVGRSRYIPADVRRIVALRDQGRCAFVGPSGRCAATRFLEWHHIKPFGHQGPATVENIALRCRAHNVYESELVFGRFDPSVFREAGETHAVSPEIAPFRNGDPWHGRSVASKPTTSIGRAER